MSQNLRSRTATSTSAAPTVDEREVSPPSPAATTSPSLSQRALESTAHLANLLPTGTLLAFQLLTPIFTNNGSCDAATRPMTLVLLSILALSCFLACFTDSVRARDGQVYYGFATRRGLWLFDSQAAAASGISGGADLVKFRAGSIDYVHAVLSVLVFVAIALKDKNVVSCLYPRPNHETQEVLDVVPIGIGLLCSLMFLVFPTRRHGIGFPVTSGKSDL
ncbi:protein DMP3 [Ipomoea triloba]|uniref:protein DMP3 n=1 Tax=Ipomoea triloba TaxID=35885 RepID=UPI00125E34D0|nr:protein DMP3 [Ipomoea triloba]